MKLSVVIVNYNVKFYLEQCLHSLQKATKDIECEVYVVDNHSRDGSVDYLSCRFPRVNIISSNRNLGFARANNLAIRRSSGEYVLLLNPDTIVGEHTIADVIGFMDAHPNAGAAGVRMAQCNGADAMESRRGIPTPMTGFYKMSGLCARFPKSRRFAHYYMSYLSWDEPERIEVVSGAFCMLRRSALDKVGLLDEDYFMYGEDIDLSFRLIKGGFDNWYVPSRILHYKGESTHKSSFRYVHVFYGAMLIFLRKHYGNMRLLLSLPVKFAIYAKALGELGRMQVIRLRKSLGFFVVNNRKDPAYVFLGSRKAMAQCRNIMRRKGLDAVFYERNAEENPEGHLGMDLPKNNIVYVVYDVDSYAYDDILNIFAKGTADNVFIGTYNSRTRIIITPEEIFK